MGTGDVACDDSVCYAYRGIRRDYQDYRGVAGMDAAVYVYGRRAELWHDNGCAADIPELDVWALGLCFGYGAVFACYDRWTGVDTKEDVYMRKLLVIIAIFIGIIFIIPTIGIVMGSVRTDQGLAKSPPDFIPTDYTLRNYRQLFAYPVRQWFWNSTVVVVLATILMISITAITGYGFAKKAVPFKEKIFWAMMISLMVPGSVTFVPMFVLMKNLGLIDTHAALILPGGLYVAYVFYYRQYVMGLPDEFIDMAEMDGCGELRTLGKIVLPMTMPAIASIILLTALPKWNDFIGPLIYIFTPSKFTLPLGIQQVLYSDAMQKMTKYEPNFGLMMAGATLIFAPMAVTFFLFRKRFAQGLWGGQLK